MTDLSQLTIKELKAICTSHAIEPVGDKRSKATWILAIETSQSEQTVIEIIETLPAIPDPFENQFEVDQSINLPLTEAAVSPLPKKPQPITKSKHGASIVVLIPLILLSIVVVAIRIGFSTLIPLIASVRRLSVAVWRSIFRSIELVSIDYFPA